MYSCPARTLYLVSDAEFEFWTGTPVPSYAVSSGQVRPAGNQAPGSSGSEPVAGGLLEVVLQPGPGGDGGLGVVRAEEPGRRQGQRSSPHPVVNEVQTGAPERCSRCRCGTDA